MIDWIKYFPLEIRNIEKFKKQETPRGPSFNFATTKEFNIGGSQLCFKTPRHRPSQSSYKSFNAGHRSDLLLHRYSEYSRDTMPDDSWLSMPAFSRNFAFYGPWFIGPQYQLGMYINIITPRTPKEDVSFFHPRALENALANHLISLYGHEGSNTNRSSVAPINWTPNKSLPVPAVVYDIMPAPENNTGSREQIFSFPVTNQHILKVILVHDIYDQDMALSIEQLKDLFDVTPMEQLADDILKSFKLTLSPEIQAQYDRVKATCPDMSLVEEFAPLKWSTDVNGHPHNELPGIESKTA